MSWRTTGFLRKPSCSIVFDKNPPMNFFSCLKTRPRSNMTPPMLLKKKETEPTNALVEQGGQNWEKQRARKYVESVSETNRNSALFVKTRPKTINKNCASKPLSWIQPTNSPKNAYSSQMWSQNSKTRFWPGMKRKKESFVVNNSLREHCWREKIEIW